MKSGFLSKAQSAMKYVTVGKVRNSLYFQRTLDYTSPIAFFVTILLGFAFALLSYETLRDIFLRKNFIADLQIVPVGENGDSLFDKLTFNEYMRMSDFKVEVYYTKVF